MSAIHTYDPRFAALKKMQRNGKNSLTMLQDNRNLILQLIRKNGSISRKQLSELSGLQQATVTIIMKELLEQGLVCENGMIDGGNGRRVKSFTMSQNLCTIIIRLTSVYIKISLFNINLKPIYVEKIFFQTDDYIEEMMSLIKKHIMEIEKIVDKEDIMGLMIGVEHKYKLMNDDYFIWDERNQIYYPIGKQVHDMTGYKVFVNRAINFSSYDLWDRYHIYRKTNEKYVTMICIQVGYDVEGSVIVNHEILYGKNGLCGQIRDMKISRDSDKTYKDVITVPAIIKRATELLKDYPDSCIAEKKELNIRDIIAGYGKGDSLCRVVYDEVAKCLAIVVSQILNWFDPDTILIEDEVPQYAEWVAVLQREVAKYCNEEKALRVGTLAGERLTKNDPALIGGAKYAFDLLIGDIGLF